MGNKAKREYLEAILPRYRRDSKKEKQSILDEFCRVCDYNRKYAVRLLRSKLARPAYHHRQVAQARRAGRPKLYDDPQLVEFLTRLWRAMDLACSKRIKAAIVSSRSSGGTMCSAPTAHEAGIFAMRECNL